MDVVLREAVARIDRVCPPQKKAVGETKTQLESYAYLYNMAWSGFQLAGFIIILFIFLISPDNEFNITEKCCTAQPDEVLRDELGVPRKICSQASCQLYNGLYDGERDFFQKRPRRPQDGDHSSIFEWDGGRWCCNLSKSETECCDRQPWGAMCTACMWVAAFSAICAMVMTQTVLQGIYSFSARLQPWHPILTVFPVAVLRTLMFFAIFYIFWGFMFCFIFFWVPMFYCDNPHAFRYYRLGYRYLYWWFVHFGDVFAQGASEPWDGKIDSASFVGSHSIFSICCDFIFTVAYFFLNKTKDKQNNSYINLCYFDL
jgi:hypothetical protein